jgi:hypothetical protein
MEAAMKAIIKAEIVDLAKDDPPRARASPLSGGISAAFPP